MQLLKAFTCLNKRNRTSRVWHNFYSITHVKWFISILAVLITGGILFPVLRHRIIRPDEFDATKDLFI